jgi:hypothetical protein
MLVQGAVLLNKNKLYKDAIRIFEHIMAAWQKTINTEDHGAAPLPIDFRAS